MKLRDQIAERAIGVAEAPCHFGQRLAFDNDGADGLVAPLHRRLRIDKELSAVHDLPSNCHSFC
jgi:hypothetical protein